MKFLKQKAGFGTGTLVGLLIVAVLAGALVPVSLKEKVIRSSIYRGSRWQFHRSVQFAVGSFASYHCDSCSSWILENRRSWNEVNLQTI